MSCQEQVIGRMICAIRIALTERIRATWFHSLNIVGNDLLKDTSPRISSRIHIRIVDAYKKEIVVMDMNPAFKAAVRKALDRPLIIADRFHYSRYIHWALDDVRRKVQKEFKFV